MVDLVLGIAAAVGASTLYSLGIAFQAMDAKEAPQEEHLRLALAAGLLRRARWLLGTGLSMLGWPLQVWRCCWRRWWWCSRRSRRACWCCCCWRERMLGEHAGRYEHLAMARS